MKEKEEGVYVYICRLIDGKKERMELVQSFVVDLVGVEQNHPRS